jgi:hypothetical protein
VVCGFRDKIIDKTSSTLPFGPRIEAFLAPERRVP